MAAQSCILAWRIPWTEEPGRLQSMGHKQLDMTKRLTHSFELSPRLGVNNFNLSCYLNIELHLFITDMNSDLWPKREVEDCQSLWLGCGKFMGIVVVFVSAMYPIFCIGQLIQLLFL